MYRFTLGDFFQYYQVKGFLVKTECMVFVMKINVDDQIKGLTDLITFQLCTISMNKITVNIILVQ